MSLSNELISEFVRVTNDTKKTKEASIVQGTAVEFEGKIYVRLDGSELLTPVSTTAHAKPGDRVTVTIQNHTATVTGNMSSPSARNDDLEDLGESVEEIGSKISEFEIVIADKVDTKEFNAQTGRIDSLQSDNVVIKEQLTAANASIESIIADNVVINETLVANDADIKKLQTDKLDASLADITYATIDSLDAIDVRVHNLDAVHGEFAALTTGKFEAIEGEILELDTKKLTAEEADIKYANIEFSNIGKAAMENLFAKSGLIEDVVIGDGIITGKLVGVTISGDLIEGDTIVAEKLVIKGDDGLYYKLNTDGVKTELEQTDYNSINGSVIKAKSITATKISVSDLVAFGATIGGFVISDSAIHSAVKTSVDNTTRGIYMDKEGQMSVGDATNYLKYYKDANGKYRLAVSADSILFGAKSTSIEQALDDIEVGGRNLLLESATKNISAHGGPTITREYNVEVTEWSATDAIRVYGSGGTANVIGTLSGTSCPGAASESKYYALSVYIKNNHETNSIIVTGNHINAAGVTVGPGELTRVEIVGLGNGWGYIQINFKTQTAGDEFDFTYWHPKLEFGNKVTDWSPAPEDLAKNEELDNVKSTTEELNTRLTSSEALIQTLSDSISMLVTDGNGTSLMTQTENGWTFSTAEIQAAVNKTSESLNSLTEDVGNVNNTVDVLRQAMQDLGAITEYVKIGTYEDEPCIELGEGDSDFKLIITNTRIMFMEGSAMPAYINNQSLNIGKAVIEKELHQGGFVWKARPNGNLGLVWKGVNS